MSEPLNRQNHALPRWPDAQRQAILGELELMLASGAFRTSKRSRQFLDYIVRQALDGNVEHLKERFIGVAVFERPATYDTGEDATVRVAANEVRKRLAQYHQEAGARAVRIELPPGSYVPEIHLPETAAEEPEVRRPRVKTWRWLARAGVVGLVLLAVAPLWRASRPSDYDRFWAPLLNSPRPVLVCMAHPVVYLLSDKVLREYAARAGVDELAGPYVVPANPAQLGPGDLIPSPDQFVGAGDAYAAGQFMGMLNRSQKAGHLRIGNDVSFTDLRTSAAVLIGAYSNRWTMLSNADYRFSFAHFSVVDRSAPGREWKLSSVTPDFKSTEDYAIVSRVLQSYSGQPVVTAAGVTNFGTRAAAEFLTNPAELDAALAAAPKGWEKRNMQLVLHCKVIGTTPGPLRVVAAHYW
jgi:hypothetical protein